MQNYSSLPWDLPPRSRPFSNLYPAESLRGALLVHLQGEVDSSKARCSGPFREAQAFTSKALILFLLN